MSWDIRVLAVKETEVYERNVTYNNSGIFHKALGCNFRDLDGKKGSDVLQIITHGIQDILQNRNDYVPLEPENGWGGIDDVLGVLRGLRSSIEEYPDSIIGVS